MFGSELRAEHAAVATRVFNQYTRTKLPDGSFKPESYALANGGCWGSVAGDGIGEMPFRELAGVLAVPMEQRGYISGKPPEETDLLIFVMWGTTNGTDSDGDSGGPSSLKGGMTAMDNLRQASRMTQMHKVGLSATGVGEELRWQAVSGADEMESFFTMTLMEQKVRDRRDLKNAMMLGFQDDMLRASDLSFFQFSSDFYSDLRVDRYYVIMKAYDFQLAWKEQRKKILWEARFSVQRPGTDFAAVLPSMAQYASRYFGRDSKGLIRDRLPEVKIIYGDSKMVRFEESK